MSTAMRSEWNGEASLGNLDAVQAFIEEGLDGAGVSMKTQMQIALAVEEIFVNIASYAYAPGTGEARVSVEVSDAPAAVEICFSDHGSPYDPLSKADPDVTLSADEREIGGLGVFMTKKLMDELRYEYRDGWNHLTLRKKLV